MVAAASLLEAPHRLADVPGTVEIVLPVHDEQAGLEASVRRLHGYLAERFPMTWTITIADNASTDATWAVACRLAGELDGVRAVHLDAKGRGRALRAVWSTSRSPVLAYMDIDLSTDLDALLPLVAPLVSGHSDVAIGTRLARGAQVVRGAKREAISRAYNLLVRTALGTGFTDAQCGFKAIRRDAARLLLPLVENDEWFFDTELLVLAEHNGLRVHEVPVDWVDDPDSRVHVVSTAVEDLRGVWRLLGALADGRASLPDGRGPGSAVPALGVVDQAVRFASIGLVSTVVGTALFLLLCPALGPLGANAVAFGLCAVANTAANRRFTFALRGRGGRRRHWRGSLVLGLAPLALTTLLLAGLLGAGVTSPAALAVALALANALLAAAKFTILRRWVYRRAAPARRPGPATMPA